MKKFGLVGGVGYLATMEYYKSINEGYVKRIANAPNSGINPLMTIESLNIADAYKLVQQNNWADFAKMLIRAINVLHGAGVEFAAIAANTAHIVFDEVQAASPIPLISIVDETCKQAQVLNVKKMVIFGTNFTMGSGMYEAKSKQYGIESIVPNEKDRQTIHNVIFPNLESGLVLKHEKAALLSIAEKLINEHNADALVLGCTELPFAIKVEDLKAAVLDTGTIHVNAILDGILL